MKWTNTADVTAIFIIIHVNILQKLEEVLYVYQPTSKPQKQVLLPVITTICWPYFYSNNLLLVIDM